MNWIILSQLSALTNSIRTVLLKKTTLKCSPNISIWILLLFSQIVLLPIVIIKGFPELNQSFWIYFSLRILVDTFALYFYGKAIKLGEVSKINPLSAISPVIVLLSSIFINNEIPSLMGAIGITIISIGIYWLNTAKITTKDIFSPFKNILLDKSSFFMAISAFFWGLMPTLSKPAIENSSVEFYTWFGAFVLLLIFTVMILFNQRKELLEITSSKNFIKMAPVGIFDGIQVLTKMAAISLTITAYASAASRSSLIFTTILSALFLKEKVTQRIGPTILIVIGLVMISLA